MCSSKSYIIRSICIQFVCMELSTFKVIIKIYLIVHVIFKYFPITCVFFFIQLFRDHPLTIKKRFLSVLFMLIFSPLYTWHFIQDKTKVRLEHRIHLPILLFQLLKLLFLGAYLVLVGFEMGWYIYICSVFIHLNVYFFFWFNLFNFF